MAKPSRRGPDPDWGQNMRYMGSAGGRHTRGNKGQNPGCLDSIIAIGGTALTLAGGVGYWFVGLLT